jgi:hypothetical protein
MRQKLITLCPITWELALKKTNFSAWVRDQLRSERNKRENNMKYCRYCATNHPIETFYDHLCSEFMDGEL